jgi:hypothetical protein
MFGETNLAGSWPSDPTVVADLASNADSIGLAAVDGGLLLAVGTPAQIAVYSVPCP